MTWDEKEDEDAKPPAFDEPRHGARQRPKISPDDEPYVVVNETSQALHGGRASQSISTAGVRVAVPGSGLSLS